MHSPPVVDEETEALRVCQAVPLSPDPACGSHLPRPLGAVPHPPGSPAVVSGIASKLDRPMGTHACLLSPLS